MTSKNNKFQLLGTREESLIWFNTSDTTGLVCSTLVWSAFLYAWGCSIYFYTLDVFNVAEEIIVTILFFLAAWAHIKVVFSDPGAVPKNAQPCDRDRNAPYIMCGRCDGFKPPKTHHDRVSNRCIVRMDHYCPWTNNAIGATNQKMFILFVIYTDVAAMYYYYLLGIIMVFCNGDNCTAFEGTSIVLARSLLFILLFAVLFTTSMILNQVYGMATGLGTIDRMKLKKGDFYVEEPVPFENVFGNDYVWCFLPINPRFDHKEAVLGYCVPCVEPHSAV